LTARRRLRKLGWRLDADATAGDSIRIDELTPPGSECSVQFGTNMTSAAAGSAQGLYLVVSDIEAVRDQLVARGVEVSEVFYEGKLGDRFQTAGASGGVSGPAPKDGSYGSFATFSARTATGGPPWMRMPYRRRRPGRAAAS
jgi:hypothetical protein